MTNTDELETFLRADASNTRARQILGRPTTRPGVEVLATMTAAEYLKVKAQLSREGLWDV